MIVVPGKSATMKAKEVAPDFASQVIVKAALIVPVEKSAAIDSVARARPTANARDIYAGAPVRQAPVSQLDVKRTHNVLPIAWPV